MKTLALVLAIGSCSNKGLPTTELIVGTERITVEVADDNAERARGLMHRDALDADDGMLFVYDDDRVRRFWMKDTRIPLDIAFIDRRGQIKKIEQMQPFSTDRTSSLYPVRYALEMNQGWFAEHGVSEGDPVGGLAELTGQVPSTKR